MKYIFLDWFGIPQVHKQMYQYFADMLPNRKIFEKITACHYSNFGEAKSRNLYQFTAVYSTFTMDVKLIN